MNKKSSKSLNKSSRTSLHNALQMLRDSANLTSIMAAAHGRFELAEWACSVARQTRDVQKN